MKKIVFFILLSFYCCSEKPISNKQIPNSFYDKAWIFYDKKEDLEAFVYFEKAKYIFLKNKDSLGVGKCLTNMATILYNKGDNFGSIEVSLEALKFLNKHNKENFYFLLSNYNNLGLTNYNLKNYQNSLKYYEKGAQFAEDELSKNISLNNKANVFRELRQYDNALHIFNNILKSNNKKDVNYSRTLTNFAKTKYLQNPNYKPIPEYQEALKIRLKEKDNWGLNSSYAHLADYYITKNQDSALSYARKMYEISKVIKSPDDQIEALQKLITLESSENSKQHFKDYQKLNDSLLTARNKAKNQFALIRYETEKNKADFLKAKADSAQKENHIIVQYFGITLLLMLLIVGYLVYKKRQKRLQQEKIIEVKNTELKISKKIHDKVANKIYQILSFVENSKTVDRNALIFSLDNVYEITRDISYDKDFNENQNFVSQLSNMRSSYLSDSTKIFFVGNDEKIWTDVNFQIKTEVYLIIQELLTNMKKHSQASVVSIKFEKNENYIHMTYTDNGIGIKKLSPKNGIQNMENRIQTIHGNITFDTETNHLLKIKISFPIKN
ncbi:tetratricopeptide repeat-containing sensor histidine kinase [Soonwooa buanensis]|uniref:tetratricopeptide repeat-containing sensor histidine kinase n=1 Tax=Soonwooa buanensis TaxID=619805 RepID=UPI001181BA22|nr:tetratricopeptide repeat-containing sensor histidine kinase [Soonwooa buanensis]